MNDSDIIVEADERDTIIIPLDDAVVFPGVTSRLKVDADATVYRKFSLQNNGLLTGLFIGAEDASVAWWRIDKIID